MACSHRFQKSLLHQEITYRPSSGRDLTRDAMTWKYPSEEKGPCARAERSEAAAKHGTRVFSSHAHPSLNVFELRIVVWAW